MFTSLQSGAPGDDCNGHGTHVAASVGGLVHGVAKNVSLLAVRALECLGNGTVSQAPARAVCSLGVERDNLWGIGGLWLVLCTRQTPCPWAKHGSFTLAPECAGLPRTVQPCAASQGPGRLQVRFVRARRWGALGRQRRQRAWCCAM